MSKDIQRPKNFGGKRGDSIEILNEGSQSSQFSRILFKTKKEIMVRELLVDFQPGG